ncbi:DNA recombination protein Rad52 [Bradyrhizobium japonicum]|uniref:RAD52 family DNA repair protein n=1 Tax=Bradyrhizobium japonicum TaxID=375 RepID=UPI00222752A8|nr:RAD52 family DNA repair protein [Bradyrhizobium japonicum]MCW2218797.1 DNA recombination protein Rad52 [Bradyrhizobium japonicum]MCW2343411.1 DNA recombination protein Rad52 [Bradyrhizobium japonicum]
MPLNDDQKTNLSAPLNRSQVKERRQGGRTFSYVEGWHVIAEANRIFGFDGWHRETIFATCITDYEREIGENKLPGFGVTYICKVRVTVGDIVREGFGSGHGIDRDRGLAHESAVKEAETDAMKRAFMTFGNPFGLALYDKQQTNVVDESELRRQQALAPKRGEFVEHLKTTINEFDSREKLGAWWRSDGQKDARRRYELSDAEVDMLRTLVLRKGEALDAQAQA